MSGLALTDAEAFSVSVSGELQELKGLGFRVLDSSVSGLRELLHRHRVFVFDIDGVLLWGSASLSGVGEALKELRRMRKRVLFLTNTASKSRRSCAEGLTRAGIEASEHEVRRHQNLLLLLLLLLDDALPVPVSVCFLVLRVFSLDLFLCLFLSLCVPACLCVRLCMSLFLSIGVSLFPAVSLPTPMPFSTLNPKP